MCRRWLLRSSAVLLGILIGSSMVGFEALAESTWHEELYEVDGMQLSFKGYMVDDQPNGFGFIEATADGGTAMYAGMLQSGSSNGFGIWIEQGKNPTDTSVLLLAGDLQGFPSQSAINSYGVALYNDGMRYVGPFINGSPADRSYLTISPYDFVYQHRYDNGAIYSGEVRKNSKDTGPVPEGYGIFYMTETKVWAVGRFSNGEMNGYLIHANEKGIVRPGFFVGNEYVGATSQNSTIEDPYYIRLDRPSDASQPTPALTPASTPEPTPALTPAPTPEPTPALTPTPEPTKKDIFSNMCRLCRGDGKCNMCHGRIKLFVGYGQYIDCTFCDPPDVPGRCYHCRGSGICDNQKSANDGFGSYCGLCDGSFVFFP